MAYVDTPLAAQNLSDSQPLIRDNFSTANTVFGLNHYPFDNLTSKLGKHKFVSLPVLANYAAILPAPVAGDATVYSKTVSGNSQLFFTPDASGNEYQMTISDAASFAKFGTNTGYVANHQGGWSFLPGGLIFQYGTYTNSSSTGTITYPRAFPSAVYSINLSFSRSGGTSTQSVRIDSFSSANLNNFNYFSSSSTSSPLLWTAIGK